MWSVPWTKVGSFLTSLFRKQREKSNWEHFLINGTTLTRQCGADQLHQPHCTAAASRCNAECTATKANHLLERKCLITEKLVPLLPCFSSHSFLFFFCGLMKSLSSHLNGSNVQDTNYFERLVAEHKHSFQMPRLLSELFKAYVSLKTLPVLAEKAHKPSRVRRGGRGGTAVTLKFSAVLPWPSTAGFGEDNSVTPHQHESLLFWMLDALALLTKPLILLPSCLEHFFKGMLFYSTKAKEVLLSMIKWTAEVLFKQKNLV